ncbi:hypothetical protein ILUMI_05808 [Ignelater luminosus]|uniref:Gamma-glutamylcyclotransferase family protein n=1 Tax=Ignelater luminosus TaxID=2038154 RepID=A0A8K0DGZ2_IGNLU|nr:hypothetical protein ILUMI_05808 [Ignelater luminosus]
MVSKLHNIFVYGTLKKGEPNHHWFSIEEDNYYKFLCKAQTTERFPLIIATKYNIPFLLYNPGMGNYIKGEVYKINEKVLNNLDSLEKHPSFYVRELYDVKRIDANAQNIKAWIYVMKNFKPELLHKPFFDDYSSEGAHGLKFATKFERDYDYRTEILLF